LALAKEAARHYRWENVAKGVIAVAQGRLADWYVARHERQQKLNQIAAIAAAWPTHAGTRHPIPAWS
jgi:hypothetical protein